MDSNKKKILKKQGFILIPNVLSKKTISKLRDLTRIHCYYSGIKKHDGVRQPHAFRYAPFTLDVFRSNDNLRDEITSIFGKSWSITGSKADPGIIPTFCQKLFYAIEHHLQSDTCVTVECSFLEIYNERVQDLLNPDGTNLKVREHPITGVFVEGLSYCSCSSYNDIEELLVQYDMNTTFDIEIESTIKSVLNDKKSFNKYINVISVDEIANGEILKIDIVEFENIIREYLNK